MKAAFLHLIAGLFFFKLDTNLLLVFIITLNKAQDIFMKAKHNFHHFWHFSEKK